MPECLSNLGGRAGRWVCVLAVLFATGPIGSLVAHAQEPSGAAVAAALEQAIADAIERAEPAVVSIARYRRDEALELSLEPRPPSNDVIPNEFGTGVIVDARGLVLTNYHVLGEDSDYRITTVDGRTYDATIKGADPRSDLAVLELADVDSNETFTPIPLGDASKLRKGQFVIALGNPYAIARDGKASASWGIVANLARKASPPLYNEDPAAVKQTIHQFGTLIQTDAKLNLGTSGGPLLNLQGEMIGLITSEAAISGFEQAAGYAIPVDETFRWVVDKLKEGREAEYGFLGVQPANLSPELRLRGTLLNSVVAGTPAYRAGLRTDDVVVAVNGEPIDGVDQLMLYVGRLPAASTVRLTVERSGGRKEILAELAKFRVAGKKVITQPAPIWRGARVDYVTAVMDLRNPRAFLPESGIVVTEVETGSPAWEAGLRSDMLLTHVESTSVASPREFHAAVDGREGEMVTLRVWNSPSDQSTFKVAAP
ncbi:MAG: trypsin-like peptidase domain-containing protein [Pirellulales bacterium]|nr:trypsin-like peptidase domain-containing protein [Pirellulales bacterium]